MEYLLQSQNGKEAVTAEGMSADIVLTGKNVTVRQGNQVVMEIVGKLDVLYCVGGSNNALGFYWDGSKNVLVTAGINTSFSGTPLYLIIQGSPSPTNTKATICGKPFVQNQFKIYTAADGLTNAITCSDVNHPFGTAVVLGVK